MEFQVVSFAGTVAYCMFVRSTEYNKLLYHNIVVFHKKVRCSFHKNCSVDKRPFLFLEFLCNLL